MLALEHLIQPVLKEHASASYASERPTTAVDVASHTQSRQRVFLQQLQREIYEEYPPDFREVTEVLRTHGFRRPELIETSVEHETNRFLNWLRLTHAPGEE